MKKLALIAAVVFTTLTLNSCRQADEVLSPDEMATLQKVRDTSKVTSPSNETTTLNTDNGTTTPSNLEGEIAAPPRR